MRGWLLVALQGVLIVALVLAPHRSPALPVVLAGGALAGLGAWLLLASGRALGRALTATPVPNGAGLVTDGPYARVRHPIYAALLLMATGWVVALGSWWSVLAAVALLAFLLAKARWEDALLARAYGDAWQAWAARTGALLPRWRR